MEKREIHTPPRGASFFFFYRLILLLTIYAQVIET